MEHPLFKIFKISPALSPTILYIAHGISNFEKSSACFQAMAGARKSGVGHVPSMVYIFTNVK